MADSDTVLPVLTDAATLEEMINVLDEHLHIEMEGEFQQRNLCQVLIRPASNRESIEQSCKTLEDAPTGNDVRYHLNKLQERKAVERDLNQALRSRVPGRGFVMY